MRQPRGIEIGSVEMHTHVPRGRRVQVTVVACGTRGAVTIDMVEVGCEDLDFSMVMLGAAAVVVVVVVVAAVVVVIRPPSEASQIQETLQAH